MLTHLALASHKQRKNYLEKLDPEKTTWIVPHLRSKIEIQNQLFQRDGFVVEDSVLRASDFWKRLLIQQDPSIQVLSNLLLVAEARQWIRKNFSEETLHPHSAEMIVEVAQQSNEILFNKNLMETVNDWIDDRESKPSWWKWFKLAHIWVHQMMEEKLLGGSWIPSYLERSFPIQTWHKNLIVDLGVQMRTVENELFKILSQTKDVAVLIPAFQGPSRFKNQFPQLNFFPQTPPGKAARPEEPLPGVKKFFQLSSALLESKYAIHQVMEWREKHNVPLNQIEICLAEPEIYWPKIKSIADQVGIPLKRRGTTSLFSLPRIQKIISRLCIQLQEFDQAETQTFFFESEPPLLAFHDYIRRYSLLESSSDLLRIPELKDHFDPAATGKVWTKEDIVQRLYALADPNCLVSIEHLISEIDRCTLHWRSYSSGDWRNLLYKIAAQSEIPYEDETQGVLISSLESGDSFSTEYRLFVGLTESNLQPSKSALLPHQDLVEIRKDLGLRIANPEQSPLEYELFWKDQNVSTEHIYTFSHSDFQGQLQGPALFFYEKCLQNGQLNIPHFWHDDLRPEFRFEPSIRQLHEPHTDLADLLDQHPDQKQPDQQIFSQELDLLEKKINHRLEQDSKPELLVHGSFDDLSLSATHLEKYSNCAFVFFAEKVLKLKDLPEMDLDLDPMSEGQVYHRLLEEVLRHKKYSVSLDDFKVLFDQVSKELDIHVVDQELWESYQSRVYASLTQFLSFEKKWSLAHPHVEIFKFEEKFEVDIETEGSKVKFTGQVDRIDKDSFSGNLFLLDYKKRTPIQSDPSTWIQKNKIQLLFYLWILGKQPAFSEALAGAAFYTYSHPDREVGVYNSEKSVSFREIQFNQKFIFSNEDFTNLLLSLEREVSERIKKIRQGEFSPSPKEKDFCPKCSWRKTCRAPHLN